MIPMVDLKQQYKELKEEIDRGIGSALAEAKFILGPNVREFEKQAAQYLGVEYAYGVANGTDALRLALLAAGIEPGDEVITPTFTFIATAESISAIGARPVFVDIDPDSYNLDVNLLAAALTANTRAVLPVHLFGQPAAMAQIKDFCEINGLILIEDCAQSFGADINGQQTGSIGDVGCYSFFPSKNLGCYGDGGLVVCNNEEIATRLKALRNHGSFRRYFHSMIGYNSRLDELQAVVLKAKLPHINVYNQKRRDVAHLYSSLLAGTRVKIPVEDEIGTHVYHQYTLLSEKREKIISVLSRHEIATAIYYPVPLHRQEVYRDDYRNISFPVSEEIAGLCFSLPIYPELESENIVKIVDIIKSVA